MDAETLTRALGGRWHGGYGSARCPAHEDRRPSLSIKDGQNGGLLLHCFAGCEFYRIRSALEASVGTGSFTVSYHGPPRPHQANSELAVAGLVDRIWTETVVIDGTLADRYLRARGITGVLPPCLRFHRSLRHTGGDSLPTMLARVESVDGQNRGLHRTFLEPAVPVKSSRAPAKMMLGSCKGGAVRLRGGHRCLAVAEGIETTLSVGMGLEDDVALWSALSTSGMAGLKLPKRRNFGGWLLVATDGDRAGREAGAALAERALAQGWRVEVVSAPDGLDFNDLVTRALHG